MVTERPQQTLMGACMVPGGLWVTGEGTTGVSRYLLHVAKHVLPAVEDAFALLRVQVENEVSGVVLIALLIPARETRSLSLLHPCLLLS